MIFVVKLYIILHFGYKYPKEHLDHYKHLDAWVVWIFFSVLFQPGALVNFFLFDLELEAKSSEAQVFTGFRF